jgi:parallel beta-helix repeat protein
VVALVLVFLYAPVPGLEGPRIEDAQAADIAARAAAHFERIVRGQGLDRPFPSMALRPDNPVTPERVELGRLLYFDPVLSGDNDISCAHCHHPDLGLADNREVSMGKGGRGLGRDRAGGAVLRRNTPTVWNAAYGHAQFWDGRARDLEHQAEGPIQDPHEMAQDPDELVRELRAIPGYVALFEEAFAGPGGAQGAQGAQGEAAVTFQNVTHAIAAFERTLVSQDSRYDRYARGDRGALSAAERRGLNVFRSLKTRCFECHNLPTFHNPDFKVIGVPGRDGAPADTGRAEIAGAGYEHAFKVPTLRNVALTAPYMHNGRFATLSEVIDFYAQGGGAAHGFAPDALDDKIRPFAISPEERHDLIAFLHALTDESKKPAIPAAVPSGLPVVQALPNQSPELAAFVAAPAEPPRPVTRDGKRLIVRAGERIQDAIDAAGPGDTVEVYPGVYHETLTLDTSDLRLIGVSEGGQRPVLDGLGTLSDAVIGTARDVEIRGFDMRNYTANGVMINLGKDIVMRDLRVENTGLYGLYPVEVAGVVIEGCTVTGARDAGIYVGQSRDIQVRNSKAHGNVTGIEIENSVEAVVEANEVYDNTAGILVFLLPNNPSKVASDTIVRGNRVHDNNRDNFGDPSAIVSRVPPGVGVIVLAADHTEVTGNDVRDNRSFGVAVSSLYTFLGTKAYDVDPIPEGNWIHGNTLVHNGYEPAPAVMAAGYAGADLLWDLSGTENGWDQPGASRLPYTLPHRDWSGLRRRANLRLWQLAMKLL